MFVGNQLQSQDRPRKHHLSPLQPSCIRIHFLGVNVWIHLYICTYIYLRSYVRKYVQSYESTCVHIRVRTAWTMPSLTSPTFVLTYTFVHTCVRMYGHIPTFV